MLAMMVRVFAGWVDSTGNTHEKIYDVACANNRTIENNRCNKPVGNTVNINTAHYTNTIGEVMLNAYWQDPAFDPSQLAFYYIRVLEIPTPRWITYDGAFYGTKLPKGIPATHQERAYTSPIWYTPNS